LLEKETLTFSTQSDSLSWIPSSSIMSNSQLFISNKLCCIFLCCRDDDKPADVGHRRSNSASLILMNM
jgi:hypothetical protein